MSPIILPVPHIRQHHQGECLVACAAMSLAYSKRETNYHHLLRLLRVKSGIGAPISNIFLLERLGVKVIYKKGSLTEIHNHLRSNRPCLTPVETSELPYWNETSSHIVVVVGLDSNFVYLNDPSFADAPIRVSHGDFDLAWLEWDERYIVLW